ncbi:hypothetical protein C2845_PM10G08320 [Panicum miliaceum]|uniref:Cyanobacterial aminoacyl-tRNA synthetase CAAD domain-containing protein n=1 Tax=Panicum miliaceum TaxID=4540 RepID=A0A3L6PA41_PANMI|nr:hypothetical protein C2845_PM10G08320 [Panicum miliaceum]
MASPVCTTNAAAGTRAGHGLPVPRGGPPPPSAPAALRRRTLPTRGLSCIKMLQHFSEWGKPMKISGSDVIKVGMTALEVLLGFKEISTYAIYGTGAFFAGWFLSAVVSALDSIPLLPKILEIEGLGYTIWFGTRYLLFKENRDELLVKVEDLKRRIFGSCDE